MRRKWICEKLPNTSRTLYLLVKGYSDVQVGFNNWSSKKTNTKLVTIIDGMTQAKHIPYRDIIAWSRHRYSRIWAIDIMMCNYEKSKIPKHPTIEFFKELHNKGIRI
jgi:hypothetical protein